VINLVPSVFGFCIMIAFFSLARHKKYHFLFYFASKKLSFLTGFTTSFFVSFNLFSPRPLGKTERGYGTTNGIKSGSVVYIHWCRVTQNCCGSGETSVQTGPVGYHVIDPIPLFNLTYTFHILLCYCSKESATERDGEACP
jgi:hypothetical protein